MPGRPAQEALKAGLQQTDELVDQARDKESGNCRGTRMTRSATLTDYEKLRLVVDRKRRRKRPPKSVD